MGGFSSRLSRWYAGVSTKETPGKTTILYKLKEGTVVETISTVGVNLEKFRFKKVTLAVLDIGGQEANRPLWRCYMGSMRGVIVVVDSKDAERVDEAAETLHHFVLSYLRNPGTEALLVLANKQDLCGAVDTETLIERLGLRSLQRPWHIHATCATTGEGLSEGLSWLTDKLSR
ncbi:ARF/SAR superfamily [Exidia glandulosa HHB12029]|uniref:ARF/SAR superfamily n=1 Tax=Exidia glandulosa HHB12029 TaxID=1314781 RepID=A0A165L3X8_EXIGL|nr:ARF/SAR superfamily [Exidia glandulosa HHB12029]